MSAEWRVTQQPSGNMPPRSPITSSTMVGIYYLPCSLKLFHLSNRLHSTHIWLSSLVINRFHIIKNVLHYHNLQYQAYWSTQNRRNGQNSRFWHFLRTISLQRKEDKQGPQAVGPAYLRNLDSWLYSRNYGLIIKVFRGNPKLLFNLPMYSTIFSWNTGSASSPVKAPPPTK